MGVERFVLGLAKKVLLANNFAYVADQVFEMPLAEFDSSVAWLGIISYALQIYFDFAGYSDMAIGLGRMFGFEFFRKFQLSLYFPIHKRILASLGIYHFPPGLEIIYTFPWVEIAKELD